MKEPNCFWLIGRTTLHHISAVGRWYTSVHCQRIPVLQKCKADTSAIDRPCMLLRKPGHSVTFRMLAIVHLTGYDRCDFVHVHGVHSHAPQYLVTNHERGVRKFKAIFVAPLLCLRSETAVWTLRIQEESKQIHFDFRRQFPSFRDDASSTQASRNCFGNIVVSHLHASNLLREFAADCNQKFAPAHVEETLLPYVHTAYAFVCKRQIG